MAYYRLYFIGGGGGPIFDFREFEVADDAVALAVADGFRQIGAMELWCGGRKVSRWEPIAAGPSAPAPHPARRMGAKYALLPDRQERIAARIEGRDSDVGQRLADDAGHVGARVKR